MNEYFFILIKKKIFVYCNGKHLHQLLLWPISGVLVRFFKFFSFLGSWNSRNNFKIFTYPRVYEKCLDTLNYP